jgi:hypothetical protein
LFSTFSSVENKLLKTINQKIHPITDKIKDETNVGQKILQKPILGVLITKTYLI